MRRWIGLGLGALTALAGTAGAAERTSNSPDCLYVEAKGQTTMTLRLWVPRTTARFTVGVYDQKDDSATAKASTFVLRSGDGKVSRSLDQPTAGGWADYAVATDGHWGVWTLSVSGATAPAAAAGKAAPNPRNAFMVRTVGEVDLYLRPESTPKKLWLGAPQFGGADHRLWVQAPGEAEVRLTTMRPADPATTVMALSPTTPSASVTWEGMARGGVESLTVRGERLRGIYPLTVTQVTAPYRLGAAGNLRLFCAPQPTMALSPLPVVTRYAGQPAAARLDFVADDGRAEAFTLFTGADGRANAPLVAGVSYQVKASHGQESSVVKLRVDGAAETLAVNLYPAVSRPAGWYCGDSHMHSIYSDGADTPAQMTQAARAEGLDFHFLSDHGTGTDLPHVAQAHGELAAFNRPGEFLAMRGTEYTLGPYHANVLGELFSFEPNRPLQEMLDSANARHGFGHAVAVQLNHPTWTGTPKAPELARELQRLPAIELFNGPEPGGIQLWWELLNRGMRVAATTNTDSHGRVGGAVGSRRTYVYLGDEPLLEANVIAAIREGRAYLSTGAVLDPAINGARPGATIRGGKLTATTTVQSDEPVDRVDLVVNGKVVDTANLKGAKSGHFTLSGSAESGWAVIQVLAKDNPTPLALTNAVYVRAPK